MYQITTEKINDLLSLFKQGKIFSFDISTSGEEAANEIVTLIVLQSSYDPEFPISKGKKTRESETTVHAVFRHRELRINYSGTKLNLFDYFPSIHLAKFFELMVSTEHIIFTGDLDFTPIPTPIVILSCTYILKSVGNKRDALNDVELMLEGKSISNVDIGFSQVTNEYVQTEKNMSVSSCALFSYGYVNFLFSFVSITPAILATELQILKRLRELCNSTLE